MARDFREEKLSERVALNLSEAELCDTAHQAEFDGLTVSAFIRKSLREKLYGVSRRPRRDGNEVVSAFGALKGAASNE